MSIPDPTLATRADAVLDRLRALANRTVAGGGPADPGNAATAGVWQKTIEETRSHLENPAHPVVFIGTVGVGKSAFIGVLANLLVGARPTDRTTLKEGSVLAIGSGRTTVCEVRIRAPLPEDENKVGLVLEPFSPEEVAEEMELYAQDEWARRQTEASRGREDETDDSSQEVHRVLRGLAGYAEHQETYVDRGVKRRRNVRPLDEVVPRFGTASDLAAHMIERANLPARDRKSWWWDDTSPENLRALKKVFADVNQGSEPTATLPRRLWVVVPEPLPGSATPGDLTLIDTRGLDGNAESRSDLQDLLRDRRAAIVLCAPFKDAPGDRLRGLLRSMAGDAELRQAIPRTLLVILDHGDADQVNGAGGDREIGQEIKIEECHIALEGSGSAPRIDRTQVVAFDALKDDRARLIAAIDERVSSLRKSWMDSLHEQLKDAESFLDSTGDDVLSARRDDVDRQIRDVLAQHPLADAPLRDPIDGMYEAIRDCRHAAIVYAACRRKGRYWRLDLYAAAQAEAARAASAWLDDVVFAVMGKLDEMLADSGLASVHDHVRLRRRQFEEGQIAVVSGYASQVGGQVRAAMQGDPVWSACRAEWGRGAGFKFRVIAHLEGWSAKQQSVDAHERTDVEAELPLLSEVVQPSRAPRFTLTVRHLRALRRVKWTPEPVSVLIGANGSGKTTLLQILRLLRLAYERTLPEAVNMVLGGVHNLRSWGAPGGEPVEVTVEMGETSWSLEIGSWEGAVDPASRERLTDRGREVFSRDSLGNSTYRGERLEPSPQTGLRVLVDRRVHEPGLRRLALFLQKLSVYGEPDLWSLRAQGSRTTDDRALHSRGNNAFTLLRRWYQDRAGRARYQFVVDGLKAAFPGAVSEIDFVEAGNTLVARFYRPGVELPSPAETEANGVLQLLVLLCDLAAAEDGGVVAIDEPENGLHPYALRSFLKRTTQWAKRHNLTVLLATHSTVLLDALNDRPECVFVMKTPESGEPVPATLDQLCDREWRERFMLGALYEQGEIGSNEDEA